MLSILQFTRQRSHCASPRMERSQESVWEKSPFLETEWERFPFLVSPLSNHSSLAPYSLALQTTCKPLALLSCWFCSHFPSGTEYPGILSPQMSRTHLSFKTQFMPQLLYEALPSSSHFYPQPPVGQNWPSPSLCSHRVQYRRSSWPFQHFIPLNFLKVEATHLHSKPYTRL